MGTSTGLTAMAEDKKSAKKDDEKKGKSAPSCSGVKMAYNECFNRWYTEKFLKGQWEKEECIAEWEAYRACLSKRLEDRNLSHLLRLEHLMLAANRKE